MVDKRRGTGASFFYNYRELTSNYSIHSIQVIYSENKATGTKEEIRKHMIILLAPGLL